jgi:hypothetical protein
VRVGIEHHARQKDSSGRQEVIRNSHQRMRTLFSDLGPVGVSQPRVSDRRVIGTRAAGESFDSRGGPVE